MKFTFEWLQEKSSSQNSHAFLSKFEGSGNPILDWECKHLFVPGMSICQWMTKETYVNRKIKTKRCFYCESKMSAIEETFKTLGIENVEIEEINGEFLNKIEGEKYSRLCYIPPSD